MQKGAVFTSIKTISGVQIFLLISMTFALSFMLGQDVAIVSASTVTLVSPDGKKTQPAEQGDSYYRTLIQQGWKESTVTSPAPTTPTSSIPALANTAAQTTTLLGPQVFKQGVQEFVAVDPAVTKVLPGYGEITRYNINVGTAGEKTYELLLADGTTKSVSATQFESLANEEFKKAFTPYTAPVTTNPAVYKGCLFGVGSFCATGGLGYLYTAVTHALIVAGIAQAIGALAGLGKDNTNALTLSFVAGTVAYDTIVAARGLGWINKGGFLAKNAGLIGVGVAIAVLVLTYKKESQKLVTFQCLPWEPKLGGESCEQCNKDPLRPCSEYRCKSLGQACQLLNPNTDKAQCAWVSKGDVVSPTIQEWAEALRPTSLQYTPSQAIRPNARGVSIVSSATEDNCLPAFTNLQFGILTNEPAQCKIDYNRSVNFDSMQYYFGESNYYEYNHTQRMRLPAPDSLDTDLSPLLQNDGTFSLFVRCRDANGNVNEDEYSINFCVATGPDTTPPIIEGTSLEDGSPVSFGSDVVPIEVYTNEPSQCKWSINDMEYGSMENTLKCAEDASQVNADLQYTCSGNLTGIQNNAEKKFYFRCIDQPGAPETERNEMRESYELTLRGTRPLTLLSAGPNATTIQASTSAVNVELFAETDDGADEGVSTCYFSPTGASGSYLEFFNTKAVEHKQTLVLSSGNYTYYLRCVDAGGNSVNTSIRFGVGVDKNAPIITRVYKRGDDALQIITNEDAECSYSKTSCNFNLDEGLPMNYADAENSRVHLTEWKAKSTYYVKCSDKYGNEPSPNSCSIVVSGVDLSARAVL